MGLVKGLWPSEISRLMVWSTENPLSGEVALQGSKHGFAHTLAIMAMADAGTIHNLPKIRDTRVLIEILAMAFIRVEVSGRTLHFSERLWTDQITLTQNTLAKSRNIYCLLPALLLACRKLNLEGQPTGCRFDQRPDSWYFETLKSFGVQTVAGNNKISLSWPERYPATIYLRLPSVTCSVITLAASLATRGTTTLTGGSTEPSVREALLLARKAGSSVGGSGRSLSLDSRHAPVIQAAELLPDQEEMVTLACATAMSGGHIHLTSTRSTDNSKFLSLAQSIGLHARASERSIEIAHTPGSKLIPSSITVGSDPLNSSDWLPMIALSLATQSDGVSTLTDTMFADRLNFLRNIQRSSDLFVEIDKTERDGMLIGVSSITGDSQRRLEGGSVGSPRDLRGAATMVLSSLSSDSPVILEDDYHLGRGYETLPSKLAELGAVKWRRLPLLDVETLPT